MATERGTPALSRFRTAVRRKTPAKPAALVARSQAPRKLLIRFLSWKSGARLAGDWDALERRYRVHGPGPGRTRRGRAARAGRARLGRLPRRSGSGPAGR